MWESCRSVLSSERYVPFFQPCPLKEAGSAESRVGDRVNAVHLHLQSILAENAGCDVAWAFRALKSDVGIAALATTGLLPTPETEVTHLETFVALRRARFELCCPMIVVVKKKARSLASQSSFLVIESEDYRSSLLGGLGVIGSPAYSD